MTEPDAPATEEGGFDALFAPAVEIETRPVTPWTVLVVDDEPDIHAALAMVLGDMQVEGRLLRILDAYSATEARRLLEAEPDIALLLLDVVMEDTHAGLDLVRHLREELGNPLTQVVLVTGQPGYAPPREVVAQYAINDYRLKSDLSSERIHTAVYAALRAYRTHSELEQHRQHLEQRVAERTRQLEEQTLVLQAAKEAAEAANRAKGVILSNIGHQFHTPLSAVLGFANLLQRDTRLEPDQRELAQRITVNAQRLNKEIDRLLDLALLNSGKAPSAREPVDLPDLLDGMGRMALRWAEGRGLAFRLERGPGLPHSLQTDGAQLRRVLLSLLHNAARFTVQGEVVLRVTLGENGRLCFQVADTGPGVPREERERIFAPFQQGSSGAESGSGAGLGLAVSRGLVDLLGGMLRLRERPGGGALFDFCLPLEQAKGSG